MIKNLFKLYGHRGARGLMPENTLPAYARALAIGVDFVDMDVVMTRDKVVVVYHDLALNPDTTRDRAGHWVRPGQFINQMTWAELQHYDVGRLNPHSEYATHFPDQVPVDGTRIPSLEEVIDYVNAHGGEHVGFQIELKDDPDYPEQGYAPDQMARAVARILQDKGVVNRTEVQAFNWQCLLELQKINPHIATAYLTDVSSLARMKRHPTEADKWTGGHRLSDYGTIAKMIKALGGTLWDPEDLEMTQDNLDAAHAEGLRVVPWSMATLNLPLTRRLIDMGVDGIITDRPDVVAQLKR